VLDANADKALRANSDTIYTGKAGIAFLYLLKEKPEARDLLKSQTIIVSSRI